MRIVEVNGRNIVCGYIYPLAELEVGQHWAQADGTDSVVTIRDIKGSEIFYGEHANDRTFSKDQFAFQTQYCKIVD